MSEIAPREQQARVLEGTWGPCGVLGPGTALTPRGELPFGVHKAWPFSPSPVPQDPPGRHRALWVGCPPAGEQGRAGGSGDGATSRASPARADALQRGRATGKMLGKCPQTTPLGLGYPRHGARLLAAPLAGHTNTVPSHHRGVFSESCSLHVTPQRLVLSLLLLCTRDAGGTATVPIHLPPSPGHGSLLTAPPHKHNPGPRRGRAPAASSSELY